MNAFRRREKVAPAIGSALEIGVALLAVLLSLAVGSILIVLQDQSPLEVYGTLFFETLGQASGRSQVAFKATTLICTGTAAAFAFRAGLFNIGGEGQLYLGAFSAALLGLVLPRSTPPFVGIFAIVLAAFLGGGLASLLPAWLKARRGTHEVINTMMMNFIVIAVVNWLLDAVRESPEVVRTPAVFEAWRFPPFVRGFDGNGTLLLAFVAAGAVLYVLSRTRVGYELRAVGLNPSAAECGGVSIKTGIMTSLIVSGGLAGLGGINFVLGSPGYFEQHFAPFQGYMGIAVALLAKNHPLAIVPSAFLFAVLAEGSQSVQAFVPREIGTILQSITVVFVIVSSRLVERSSTARG